MTSDRSHEDVVGREGVSFGLVHRSVAEQGSGRENREPWLHGLSLINLSGKYSLFLVDPLIDRSWHVDMN